MAKLRWREDRQSFFIDYRVQGKRFRKNVGANKRKADLELKRIELALADGMLQLGSELERVILTLQEFQDKYLEFFKHVKAAETSDRDKRSFKSLIEFLGSEITIDRIGPEQLQAFLAWRLQKVAPRTAHRDMQSLQSAFKKAVAWDLLDTNPWEKVERPRYDRDVHPQFFTKHEVSDMIEKADPPLNHYIAFAVYTGLRRTELLNLRPDDIDLERRVIRVESRGRYDRSKTGKSRTVPVPSALTPHLTTLWEQAEDRVIKWRKDTLSHYFRQLLISLDIDGERSWRNLRDTYASHLVMAGVPLRGIQQLLGHSTIRMTEKYAWLATDSLEEAVSHLDFNLADQEVKSE